MYLSLLLLNPASAAVQRDLRDMTQLHRTIMRAYPDIMNPEVSARAYLGVLYRLEFHRRTGRLHLYVQSKARPDWSHLPEAYLHLDQGLTNPEVKPVGEIYAGLKAGRVLRFRLRANPTRKVDTKTGPDGAKRNGRRVPVRGADEQMAWLVRKAQGCGFALLQATIAGSGAAELVHSHKEGQTFQGVLFEGRLMVQDPERFRAALASGIGPGKAYGFGLISVAPD